MKRSPVATARRTVRRGLTWRPKQAGAVPVDIPELVSPLRYDVLVRARFFDFLQEQDPQGTRDPAELALLARDQPYYHWFELVAMPRFRPWVLKDRDLFHQQYAERVARSSALWQSYRREGFKPDHPITLRATDVPTLTDSGALVSRRLHVGDGGHRLALLLAGGRPTLEPHMYRVDPRPMAQLIDNTAVLLPVLGLSGAAYGRFVAGGYGAPDDVDDVDAVVEHVRRHRPECLQELEQVVTAHRRVTERAA